MRTFYLYIILALSATAIFAQPANDACPGAISIPVTNGSCTSGAFTNVGATSVGDPATPPCWAPNSLSNTVWFSFVAPSTAVEVSTNFGFVLTNTQVAIYSGNCGALTLIGCNEDINTSLGLFHTNIQLQGLTVGNTYFIMVDGNANSTGEFGICAQQITPASPPLPIQDCPTARFLCNTNPISVANGTGGPGIIQEAPSCFGAPGERASNWYSFTAANNGTLCFDILPTANIDYDFAVYNTTNGCLGTELACNWSGLTGVNGLTGLSGAVGAQFTPCLNVTAGQTYSILVDRFTATSAAGFTLSFTGTVQFASPNPSFTTNTVCTGNPTQFTNTTNGSNTYSWNFGNGVTSTLQNPTFTYPAAGVYSASLLVTSIPGGCQNLTTRSVTVTDPPTVNAGTSTSVCPGGCVTLNGTTNASGGLSGPVTFNNNTALNIPDNNTLVSSSIIVSGINPTTIAAGSILNVCLNITHTWDSDLDIFLRCPNGTQINLSDDNGGAGDNYTNTCFSMSAATSVIAGAPPFNGTFIPEQSFNLLNGCNVNGNWQLVIRDDLGGDVGTLTNWSITFNNTLAPFSWSPTTAMTNSGTLTPTVCPATTTTYTLTAVNAAGCTSTSTVTITPTALTATPTANNSSCNGGNNGSVNVALSGGAAPFTFIWSNGRTTQNNTGLAAGTYTVTVSDNGGCTTTATANVTAPSALTVTPTVNNVSCNGINNGSVTLNINGGTSGYNFNWGTGITSQNRTGLSPGTYTVTVSDANSCTATNSITITQPTAITVSNSSLNASCNGQNNGSINITASGGTGVLAYNWGGGIISEDRNNLAPGTYTVTVTDANSCTSTSSATITQPSGISVTNSSLNVLCNGQSNGSIDVTAAGGSGTLSYNWGGAITSEDRTGLAAGTYTVTVTDANSCTTTNTATISQPTLLNASNIVTNASCNSSANGSINLTAGGGTGVLSYNWGSGITSEDRTGLAAGVYTVTVTDANNCTTTSSATITEPTAITVSNTAANVTCNNQNNGSINITASGGTGILGYNWGAGIISEDRTGLAPGVYTVTVTDANNCTSTNTATITQPTAISVTNSSQNAVCNGQSNGSIDITANGGTGVLSYNWGGGITSEDRSGLAAGVYTVTVTDANACTNINTYTITEPSLLTASNTVSNANCNSSANGSINLTAVGGTGVLSYNWGGGITSEDRTGLAAGVYTVTVTDANACTTTSSATITEPTAITVSNTAANVTCNNQNNGSINITASGGTGVLAYNWGGGIISEDRNNLAPGIYTVTVTDANNCTSTNTATITQPTAISVTNSSQNAVCNGQSNGSIDITANGGTGVLSYNWGGGITSEDRSGLAAGVYTVTVTDANACTNINTYTITEPSLLTASNTVSNASCNSSANGSINLTAGGGTGVLSYNWGGGITSEDRTGLAAGVYTVIVTDANACTTTSSATITEPSALNTNTITITDATCSAGGTVDISASGGTGSLSFVWSNGSTSQDLNAVSAGSYSVTITDANGCSVSNGPNIVNAIGTPSASITSVNNVSCNGAANGFIDLNISGGSPSYTYLWSNGATTQDLNGLSGGSYSVTVTDNIGCTAVQTSINISEPTALTVTNTSTNVSCNNGNNGTIPVTVSGGTAGYSYIWSNGATTEDLNNISAGSYTLTVSDANGCVRVLSPVNITQPTSLNLSNVSTTTANCGAADGTITLSTNGGVTPYIYSWSNGATNEDLNNLAIGNYSLSVTDANGCILTQSFSVNGGSDISITLSSIDEGCGQPNSGSVDVTPSGGTLPLTYNWSNGATTEDLTTISAGSYTVTVSDANGCSISANTTIAAAFQPTLNAAVLPSNARDTLITWGDLTSLTGGSDQTAQGVTYTWTSIGPSNANFNNPDSINTAVEPDDDGIYQFIITAISAEGCITTDTLNVEVRANNPAIPTAFSPNNDGTNDNFRVVNMDKKFIREFKIYNRWGEVVYDNATEAEWDGKFKGTEQPRDVYMYIISWESSTGNGDVIKRGNITLLR